MRVLHEVGDLGRALNGPGRLSALLLMVLLPLMAYGQSAGGNPIKDALHALSLTASVMAGEGDFTFSPGTQTDLEHLTGDLAMAMDLKSLSAGMPLGKGRVSAGLDIENTWLGYPETWLAASGSRYDQVMVPRLHVRVGLTPTTNIGVAYLNVMHVGVQLYGLELTTLAHTSGDGLPDVVLRASYSRLEGVQGLDIASYGLEVLASGHYGNVRPFVGLGVAVGDSQVDLPGLKSSQPVMPKLSLGLEIALHWMNVGIELGHASDRSYMGMRIAHEW